jgi:hypothetical protein
MSVLQHLRGAATTADLGLRFATQDTCARPTAFAPRDQHLPMTVGIYQIDIDAKMKQIDTSARTLDKDVQANVGDPVWRSGWDAWLKDWRAYYALTQQLLRKLFSNPFNTDEIDAQVESYREQLNGWYADYRNQKGRDGRTPVPPPKGQPPVKGEEEKTGTGSSLPWWFWMVSGIAVVGVSYIVYRKYQEGRSKAAFIHKRAPGLLEKYLPGHGKEAYEYTQAGRDTDPNFAYVGRDPDHHRRRDERRDTSYIDEHRDYVLAESDMGRGPRSRDRGSPFQLSNYARSPSPYSAVHGGARGTQRDEMLYEEPLRTIPRSLPSRDYDRHYASDYDDGFDMAHDFDYDEDY